MRCARQPAPEEDPIRNSPALTGLRGIAVVTVMWLHATFPNRTIGLPGAFFTVDVFFVLSAMLITALLVAEFDGRSDISLRAFYARRGLRLLPALLATIALAVVLRLAVGPVGIGLPREIVGALLYVANWLSIAAPDKASYLDHTWSLSVEEQFYFVWPVVLTLLLRRGVRAAVVARGTAVLALVAFATRWYLYDRHHGTGPNDFKVFYLNTGSRIDELMIGATLGLLPSSTWSKVGRLAVPGFLGLAVLIHVGRIRADLIYEWGLTLSALCSVVVVAACAAGEGPIARVLATKPFVAVGTISYGLYLYHLPIVLAVDKWGPPETVRILCNLLLPVPVAVASWFLLEKRALRLKRHFQRVAL